MSSLSVAFPVNTSYVSENPKCVLADMSPYIADMPEHAPKKSNVQPRNWLDISTSHTTDEECIVKIQNLFNRTIAKPMFRNEAKHNILEKLTINHRMIALEKIHDALAPLFGKSPIETQRENIQFDKYPFDVNDPLFSIYMIYEKVIQTIDSKRMNYIDFARDLFTVADILFGNYRHQKWLLANN